MRDRPLLEEELERLAVLDEAADVGVDDGGVEAVAREAAADEERAHAAQERADGEEVEVVAGGDERQGQLVPVEHPAESHVVHVRLVRRKKDDRALLRELAQALEPCLVGLDRGEHARRRPLEEAADGRHGAHVERPLHLAEHPERPLGDDLALARALAGEVRDDLAQLGAADDLLAQPIGRLLDRADDRAALALQAPEQRVRQAPHEHVVARAAALLAQELAHVDRLARAQRRVAAVAHELRDHRSGLAGPLGRAEERVDRVGRVRRPALRDHTNTCGTSTTRALNRRCASSSARTR